MQLWGEAGSRGCTCSVLTELALGASSGTQPRLGSEERPRTCHREAVPSHSVIPQFVAGMLASPAESQGTVLAPWESSAPHVPGAGNPGNGLFSLTLHRFLLIASPLPRQDNVTHPQHSEASWSTGKTVWKMPLINCKLKENNTFNISPIFSSILNYRTLN